MRPLVPHILQHQPVPVAVGRDRPVASTWPRSSTASIVTDFLCGSTHDHSTHRIASSLGRTIGEGGQSYFEPDNPLVGHDLTTVLCGSADR